MTSSNFSFGDLIHGLEAEHHRQENTIKVLQIENKNLKAKIINPASSSSASQSAILETDAPNDGSPVEFVAPLDSNTSPQVQVHEGTQMALMANSTRKKPYRSQDSSASSNRTPLHKTTSLFDIDEDIVPAERSCSERISADELAERPNGERDQHANHTICWNSENRDQHANYVHCWNSERDSACLGVFGSELRSQSLLSSGSGAVRNSRENSKNSVVDDDDTPSRRVSLNSRPHITFVPSVNSDGHSGYSGVESCASMDSYASARNRRSIPALQQLYKEDDLVKKKSRMSQRRVSKISFETNTGNMILQAHHGSCSSVLQPFVVRPNSAKRVLWDLASVLMVSYDVIVIPLSLIDIGQSTFMEAMDWITTIYWTLDLPLCFMTGFHREGAIEMRPRSVAWNYLTSWFFFDFSVVFVDWFIIFAALLSSASSTEGGDASGILRFSKTGGRINRIFRAIRLIRFFKLQRLLVEILQLVKSEYVHTLCNVFLSILFIAVVAHYIACGWFWVGKLNDDAGVVNWITESELNFNTTMYKYATSLHWSLTQFTPASMEVRPYNLSERLYSIVVLFVAMISFSSLLGSITTAMSQLRKLQHDQTNQQIALRKFFADNKVSAELGQRIWKYIKKTHFTHRTRMPRDDLPLLTILPPTLSRDLNEELYRPYLSRLPFFLHCASIDSECLADVCMNCMSEKLVVSGDELFNDGQRAEQCYISTSGKMQYCDGETFQKIVIKPGLWVGEPALWLEWVHLGQLSASTSCEVMHLHIQEFRTTIRIHPTSLTFAREYAKEFVGYMMSLEGEKNWKTDVFTDRDQLHAVCMEAFRKLGYTKNVAAMPHKLHRGNSLSVNGTVSFFQHIKSKVLRRRNSRMLE